MRTNRLNARVAGPVFLAVAALAGCGGSSGHAAARTVTVPVYGVYSQTKVAAAAPAGPRVCRREAGNFAGETRLFLAHIRPHGAYPADLYYMIMRQQLAVFQAHGCAVKLLGRAVADALTAKQRRTLVGLLPNAMAATVSEGLQDAGS